MAIALWQVVPSVNLTTLLCHAGYIGIAQGPSSADNTNRPKFVAVTTPRLRACSQHGARLLRARQFNDRFSSKTLFFVCEFKNQLPPNISQYMKCPQASGFLINLFSLCQ